MGAGSGAYAAAVDLKLRGFEVVLCSSYEPDVDSKIKAIEAAGGISYSGELGEGFAEIRATVNDSVVEDADLVMIVTLANGYEHYARRCAGKFRSGQTIFLHPGYIGGSLRFMNILKEQGGPKIRLCESNNLAYICRATGLNHVRIFRRSNFLLFASLPRKYGPQIFDSMKQVYQFLSPAENVLETGMMNPNIVLHPAGMVLNAGWIEATKGGFFYYKDGTTPAVARVIEGFDEERIAICDAAKVKTMSLLDYYKKAGYTPESSQSIYEALKSSEPNKEIRAPETLEHRYITEDVGYGLVPLSSIAKIASVKTPTTDSLIHLASVMTGVDYAKEGLNAEKMGISDFNLGKLMSVLNEGF